MFFERFEEQGSGYYGSIMGQLFVLLTFALILIVSSFMYLIALVVCSIYEWQKKMIWPFGNWVLSFMKRRKLKKKEAFVILSRVISEALF